MNLDLDESFSDNLSINNDLLDLRFGESAYTQNDEGFSYEDMVRANHEFRAEIEDSRLQLEQTEQVLGFYSKTQIHYFIDLYEIIALLNLPSDFTLSIFQNFVLLRLSFIFILNLYQNIT